MILLSLYYMFLWVTSSIPMVQGFEPYRYVGVSKILISNLGLYLELQTNIFNYLTEAVDILGTSVNIKMSQTEFVIFLLEPILSSVFRPLVSMTALPLVLKIRILVFIFHPYSSFHSSIKLSPDSINFTS